MECPYEGRKRNRDYSLSSTLSDIPPNKFPALSDSLTMDQATFNQFLFNALSDPAIKNSLLQPLYDELAEKNREISALKEELHSLSVARDDLEQYSRNESIRIAGIPEVTETVDNGSDTDQNSIKPEDTKSVFLKTINEKLPDAKITSDDIDKIHRLPKRPQQKGPPVILCKFKHSGPKERIWSERKKEAPWNCQSADRFYQ